MAVGAVARAMFATPYVCFWSPVDVVDHDQVEPAILVIVEPTRACGPAAFIGHSRLGGHVCKCPVAVVVIQNGASVTGHIEIGIPVIVVVARRHTLAVVAFSPTPAFSVTSVKVPSP